MLIESITERLVNVQQFTLERSLLLPLSTTTASKRPSLMNNFLLRLKMLPIRKAVVKLSVMKVIANISASIAKQRNH